MEELDDISSIITVKNDLANRFKVEFRLFREESSDLDASVLIFQKNHRDLDSTLSVRVTRETALLSKVRIMYGGYEDLNATIQTTSVSQMSGFINVRPHNRFKTKFNLMSAPIIDKTLYPIADSMTRSGLDYRTMNYGDANSMMIGKTTNENFYSFIQFSNLNSAISDIKILKTAKLRLYYSSFTDGANVTISQPNTLWREMGITDANKPHSLEVLKENGYIINKTKRYIEFDFLDTVKKWFNKELDNYGFIISTEDNNRYYFMTRESSQPPELIISYITTQIYSIGRSDVDAQLFVYGAGWRDLDSRVYVPFTRTKDDLNSMLYVHRYEDPLIKEFDAELKISNPDLPSKIFTNQGGFEDLDGYINVITRAMDDTEVKVLISNPDLYSRFTIDNNMQLMSVVTVRQKKEESLITDISISNPDLLSTIVIDIHTSARSDLNSIFTYKPEVEDSLLSGIKISNPDLLGMLKVRAKDHSDLDSYMQTRIMDDWNCDIEISNPDLFGNVTIKAKGNTDLDSIIQTRIVEDIASNIKIISPDLFGVLMVSYYDDLPSIVNVRGESVLDSVINVNHASDMYSIVDIYVYDDKDGLIQVSNPDLASEMSVRAIGQDDLETVVSIRQRNASDLDSYIRVGGSRNRNMIIMF